MALCRFMVLGSWLGFALQGFFAVAYARKLAQIPSPATSSDTDYLYTLQTVLEGNPRDVGPIRWKSFEGAYYSLCAETQTEPQLLGLNESQFVSFGNTSRLLAAWDARKLSLILAFSASGQDNSSLTESVSSLSPVLYLSDEFGGSPPNANPAAFSAFNSLLQNLTSSDGAINLLTGGNGTLGRVLCTGWGGGAAFAQLCGPWAQITYPAAQIRVVTFGGPRIGDDKFDWAIQEFVDLPYLWVTESDNRTVGQLPFGPLVPLNVTRVIPEDIYSGEGEQNSIKYYATLLNNTLIAQNPTIPVTLQTNWSYGYERRGADSQYLLSSAPEGGGFFSTVENIAGTIGDSFQAAGSAISNAVGNFFFGGDSAPAPAPSDFSQLAMPSGPSSSSSGTGTTQESSRPSNCTAVICKLQPAIVQACASYKDGESLGPGSSTVHADVGTDVAVQWKSDCKIATFAFRGTDGSADWRTNLRLGFTDDVSTGYFQELYNGTEVYEGELTAFRAVTDQATNSSTNITAQLLEKSGGDEPYQIHCIGHSLGGGLATLCGVWAAIRWPAADIRVVTFGSPKAGNSEFAASLYATVGRIYRVVYSNDAVPSLPPFESYLHGNYAIYLDDSSAVLDDRPPAEIGDLTWDAHGCDDQYAAALTDIQTATVPTWVKQLTS